MKKKILSFMLAITVIATSVPVSNLAVYADDFTDEEASISDEDEKTESNSIDNGTVDMEESSEEESNSETDSYEDVEELEEDFSDSENDAELTIEPEENNDVDEESETDITDEDKIDAGDGQQAGSSEESTYGDYRYTVEGDTATITGYTGSSSQIEIPAKINGYVVEKIGNSAFYCNKNLNIITIPNAVKEIGDSTFWGCNSLKRITIPSTVKEIGDYAFLGCTNLVTVEGGNNLEKIGSRVFDGCLQLRSITLSSSIKKCGGRIFAECKNLQTVGPLNGDYNIKLGFTETIPTGLFNDSEILKVTLPDTIKTIEDGAFDECESLKDIELSLELREIKSCTFYECRSLENIIIPNKVKKIGSQAFEICSNLKRITIPNTVEEIGDYAFLGCTNLVTVEGGNNLEKIGSRVFDGCLQLRSITLSSSIKKCGGRIFAECKNLQTVGPLNGDYNIKLGFTETIPTGLFNDSEILKVTLPDTIKTIEDGAFDECESLKDIELSLELREIKSCTFYECRSLENIIIPNKVKKIGSQAFEICSNLKRITIPNTVEEIGDYAFSDCPNLTIYGYTDSYAETYASEQNIPFVSIGVAVNVEEYDYSSKLDQWLLDQGTSNAMNYLVKDMNFTNSAAVATFDSDFGSRVTEAWSNMLFRGASGWKEIFTRATSREQAREVLIALLEEQSEQIELLTKAETAKKYASIFVSTFKQANWAYAIDYGLSNDEVQYLAKLCTEDKIADFFVNGKYETISAYLQAGEKIPENSKVIKCIETYSKSTKLLNAFSSVIDWGGALVKFEKMTDGTLKALYNIDSLWKADEMYAEMLGYIRDNCPFVPVSQAAADLYNVIQGGYVSALSYAATSINNTVSDTVIEAAVSSLIKKLPYGALINTTYHFSVGVANILFNTADTQKQRDNMRCIAYIGSYISKWMVNCRLQYLTGGTEDKQENARKTVYAYYMLLKTRKAGEQSLQSMMKSGKMAWKRAYAVSMEISETLKSNEKWLKDSGVLSEISTSVVACPVNVEVRNSSGKLVLTIYDGKETEGYIGNIYYSVFYNPISKDYTKIVRFPINSGYFLKCTGTDLGVVDYYQTTISDDGGTTQQEVNNIPVQKNSQVIISENAEKQPVCTLKEGDKEIKKYTAKTSSDTYIPVTSIKVDQSKLSLKVGDKQRINTTISPDNASTQGIQWTSSADGIVSVNSDGVITANKKGTAVITAKAVNDNIFTKIQVTGAEKTTACSGKFTVKLSGITYTYNGKTQKPKVKVTYKGKTLSSKYYTVVYKNNKNIGTATVTVTGKGNYKKCSGKATFKIVLKKSTLSSLKAGKKTATVSWKTITGSTGYQIQYSTSKNFAKVKTVKIAGAGKRSTTIKKLTSKKTYYVRVRAYKTVNKKTVYGTWSASKKVVVK